MRNFYQVDTLGGLDEDEALEGLWDDVKAFASKNDDLVSLVTGGPVGYAIGLAKKNNAQTPKEKAADQGLIQEIANLGQGIATRAGAGAGGIWGTPTPKPVPKPLPPPPPPPPSKLPQYAGAAALVGAGVAYYKQAPKAAMGLGALGAVLLAWPMLADFYKPKAAK